MGMSASQARLLSLTSRMNDLEYKAENIANIKIRLADESDKIAQKYTDALGKQKYTLTSYSTGQPVTTELNGHSFKAPTGAAWQAGYTFVKADGSAVSNLLSLTATQIYEMIESGEFKIQLNGSDVSAAEQVNIGIESISTAELAQAEAEYNAATSKIQRKEKELDRQQSKLDTEHEALKTERDSLKEIIRDNVDNTFKLFG